MAHRELGRLIQTSPTGASAMNYSPSVSYDQVVREKLTRDRKFAIKYLQAALDDIEEPQVLSIALRHVVAATGGMARMAKAAGVTKTSLEQGLSGNGSVRLDTLVAVLRAAG